MDFRIKYRTLMSIKRSKEDKLPLTSNFNFRNQKLTKKMRKQKQVTNFRNQKT